MEALWKHEAERRCAIPTDRAQRGRFAGIGKCRKLRENSRFRVIVHGSFDTTHNLKAALDSRAPEPFQYKSKGALASLGAGRGVAEVFGWRLTGFPAWVLWRTYYLSFVPGFATKVRIASQWMLDLVVGRSTVQTGTKMQEGTKYIRYRAGDRVFEEGNRPDGFYVVKSGRFELTWRDPKGETHRLEIGPDGHFGERALLVEGLRTGTVRAVEDSEVLFVTARDFQRLARTLPPLRTYFGDYLEEAFDIHPGPREQEPGARAG